MTKLLRLLPLVLAVLALSCAQAKYASTSMGMGIDNPVTVKFDWGEVYCGQGRVCAEVEVLRVDAENRDGGRVELTLHNRTGDSVAVQIALEIVDIHGVRIDSTSFQDVPVAPRQERAWQMPGINQKDAKIRVMMRKR